MPNEHEISLAELPGGSTRSQLQFVFWAAGAPALSVLIQSALWSALMPWTWLLFYPLRVHCLVVGGLWAGLSATTICTPSRLVSVHITQRHLAYRPSGRRRGHRHVFGMGILFSLVHESLRVIQRRSDDHKFQA